jgi:hypothetical protein
MTRTVIWCRTLDRGYSSAPEEGANRVGVKVKENYSGWAAPAGLSGPELALSCGAEKRLDRS